MQDLHRSGEVKVVAISLDKLDDGDASVVKNFVDEQKIEYPVLLGDAGLFHELGGNVIPYTLVLDRDLKIIAAHKGLVSKHVLEQGLAEAKAGA